MIIQKFMKLKKIKIQKEFDDHFPKMEKLFRKLVYYAMFRRFKEKIVIRHDGTLVDGYTTYILATILGKRYVKVRYEDEI